MELIDLNEFRIFGKHEIDFSNNTEIAQSLGIALKTNIKIYKDFTLIEKLKWFQNEIYAELSVQYDKITNEPFYIFKYRNIVMLVCKNWIEFEIPENVNNKKIKQFFESEKFVNRKIYNQIVSSLKNIGISELFFCKEEMLNSYESLNKRLQSDNDLKMNKDCIKIEWQNKI